MDEQTEAEEKPDMIKITDLELLPFPSQGYTRLRTRVSLRLTLNSASSCLGL
jgi:hypothetical protein